MYDAASTYDPPEPFDSLSEAEEDAVRLWFLFLIDDLFSKLLATPTVRGSYSSCCRHGSDQLRILCDTCMFYPCIRMPKRLTDMSSHSLGWLITDSKNRRGNQQSAFQLDFQIVHLKRLVLSSAWMKTHKLKWDSKTGGIRLGV